MAKPITSLESRLFEMFIPEPNSGCWLWIGGLMKNGYANIREGGVNGKTRLAHRCAYELHRGKIPKGLEPDHLCRTRSCINPWHMELVTHQVNCQRGIRGAMQKAITHCPHGHEYTKENTFINNKKARVCKACKRHRERKYDQ